VRGRSATEIGIEADSGVDLSLVKNPLVIQTAHGSYKLDESLASATERIRPAFLSVAHISFVDQHADLDTRQSGESAPDYGAARRVVVLPRQVAADLCELDQLVREQSVPGGTFRLLHEVVENALFEVGENEPGAGARLFAVEHGHPVHAPRDDAEDPDRTGEALCGLEA